MFDKLSANFPISPGKYPHILPILPLRGVVVYPQTAVPLTVGQPRSIKLVDDVVGGDKLVGLVAAVNPELETPGPKELFRVGTVAIVHRLLRAPDGTLRLLVQGMERFRLREFVEVEPYLKAKIGLSPELVEEGLEIDVLARKARDQFQLITQMIPSFPEELAGSITSLEDPLQTAYTIANFQRMDIKDSQEILEIDSVSEKLTKLIKLLVREAEVIRKTAEQPGDAASERIFISYRRSDSADITGRIYDRLADKFGKYSIFRDVDSIPLGVDFKKRLDAKVAECKVLLAVIGNIWVDARDESGRRRLDDPSDFVRIEIESALARDIPVIPLLVSNAKMPRKEDLPSKLRKLVLRNGISIRPDPDFHRDMDRLISSLEEHIQKGD
jgi:Lon protease-like protein